MPTTKINNGLYTFSYKGRVFEIENIKTASDGDALSGWMAYEMIGDKRIYLNDYYTKRAAIARTIEAVDAGY
jgi:hypothetical protein